MAYNVSKYDGASTLIHRATVPNKRISSYPRDPNSPMWVICTDFRAPCRYYLYTWIPRVIVEGLGKHIIVLYATFRGGYLDRSLQELRVFTVYRL